MVKLSFSTVACPEWLLRRVAHAALEFSYEGVELRTFGGGSSILPSDPALTDPAKIVGDIFADDGVEIAGLAASSRFDSPIHPPVLGWVTGDFEKEVREAKQHVDLAQCIGAGYIRVFAFEPAPAEKPSKAVKRIVQRLKLLCDHARHRGVRIALENGGGYPRASQIAEIIEKVGSPLLGASYSLASGFRAGDDPADAISTLADRLLAARINDRAGRTPCLPGDGDIPCREFAETLRDSLPAGRDSSASLRPSVWIVYEWEKLWLPELAPPEDILPEAGLRLTRWLYPARDQSSARSAHPVGLAV